MSKLDFPASPATEELVWELQQPKPDAFRIKWLVEDESADVRDALVRANLKEEDLLKKSRLRPLGLQNHLRKK